MDEFGHHAVIAPNVCIDGWGSGPFVLTVGKESWRFEDSDRFGPHLVNRNGSIKSNPWPPQRSPFWRAHRIWVRQGRRVEDGINCVWDEPKPTLIRRLNKSNMIIVEAGEEDGQYIDVENNQRINVRD